jgi:hypothetical protein
LYPLFGFNTKAVALTGAAIMMVVLLGTNLSVTNAQQQQEQQQLSTSQPVTSGVTQNATIDTPTLFESTIDSFRVQLPEGWVIQDVNNTGFTLAEEVLEGYGILAQLCPKGEEGQQQGALTNDSSSSTNTPSSCQQQVQEETIFIIRYPNLGTRLGITLDEIRDITMPASILQYQIQKLREVGYNDINIVNSTDTTISLHYITTEGVPFPEAIVPAKLVEMTYSTSSAPSEMKRGYILLTATNVTPPNLQAITGYGIFYESASGAIGATAAEQTTTPSGNLLLSAPFRQVFDSFELIISEEAAQAILGSITQQAAGNESNDQEEEEETPTPPSQGEQEEEEDGGDGGDGGGGEQEEEETPTPPSQGEQEEEETPTPPSQGEQEEEEETPQPDLGDNLAEEALRGTPLEGFFSENN